MKKRAFWDKKNPKKTSKKLTPAQKCKEWRKREGYNERYNAERKARRRIAMPFDPVLSALLGTANV